MAFSGRWKLVSSSNMTEYAKASGMPADIVEAKKAMDDPANDIVEELALDGSNLTVTLFSKGNQVNSATFALNKEIDHKGVDGREFKMTITVAGNKITRVQKGAGHEMHFERVVDGNNMTLTSTSAGVTGVRKYTKA